VQTNPAVEQNKNIKGPRVRGISPVGEENVYGGKDLPKSQVLSSENKMLSYRRQTALDSALFLAKSGRLELEDNIYGHYRSIFNHCDIISLQTYRLR